MKKAKISLIGSGNIGGTIAHLAMIDNLADIVMLDVNDGIPQGKSLDLNQSFAACNTDSNITGSVNYEDIKDSDVVIVTAGLPRKPGMSRDDLLSINGKIINEVANNIKQYAPNAFVIVITNPLDVMVYLMQKATGFNVKKVVGMAGILDTARYKHFLAKALNVSAQDIQAFVLGGHGDSMVPMPRFTTISGIPIDYFIKNKWICEQELDAIFNRTKNGGGEIVSLLKTGSAYYAPAVSALEMAKSYLYDQKRILPCAAYVDGCYDLHGTYVGVPVVIGKDGVEKIIELELNDIEKKQFKNSVDGVHSLMQACADLKI